MNVNGPLRRLPLEGAKNTRDLGGYPCLGGSVRWGAFVRSDSPEYLTEADIGYLKTYGVGNVVDLRRADEAQNYPSALAGHADFQVKNIPLSSSFHGVDFEGDVPGSMSGLYIQILDEAQSEVCAVMQAMADAASGVLFHCAVGKDRTGVVAMLLLKLAGVSDADIIADYAVTDIYMKEAYGTQQLVFSRKDIPEFVLQSRPESMERVLRHLRETYGTAREYLLQCGMAQSALTALSKKLVEPAGVSL